VVGRKAIVVLGFVIKRQILEMSVCNRCSRQGKPKKKLTKIANGKVFSMDKFTLALMLNFIFCCGSVSGGEEKTIVRTSQLQRALTSVDGRWRTVEVKNKIIDRTLTTEGPEFVLTWGDGQESTSDDFACLSVDSNSQSTTAKLENKTLHLQAEITYSIASNGQPWFYKQIKFTNTGSKPFLLRTVELEHLKIKNEKITYSVDANFPKLADWGQPDGQNILELWANFLEAIELRTRPVCDIETGHRSTNMSLLGMLSYKIGRSVKWDGKNEVIVDDSEANELLKRKYRKPWIYPEL